MWNNSYSHSLLFTLMIDLLWKAQGSFLLSLPFPSCFPSFDSFIILLDFKDEKNRNLTKDKNRQIQLHKSFPGASFQDSNVQ